MQNSGIEILLQWHTFERLLIGLSITLKIAVLSILFSWCCGIFLGVIRTFNRVSIQLIARIYLELFRFVPILVWLYVLYYLIAANFNINLNAQFVAVLVFTLWGTAEMSDIIRGALIAVPKHQTESAVAIGFNKKQLYYYVLLPQALKNAIPAMINLSVRMIMTTSLLFTLGITEVIKVGQQMIESASLSNPMASFWIYGIIFIFYFLICYPLSVLSRRMIRRI